MLRSLPKITAPRVSGNVDSPESAELVPFVELAGPRPLRVLDFDIENRPLSYWYDGNCTAEVTAIAWAWTTHPQHIAVCAIGGRFSSLDMLRFFVAAYDYADMVTGHYIRKHDLPIINGALVEHGLPTLRPKLVSDTRTDLVRWKDLQASQEALGDWLGLDAPKEKMSPADWRQANRLTPEGIEETTRRVQGDVRQHMELRAALLERGLLKAPRMWRP